jgi:hypothetical protein
MNEKNPGKGARKKKKRKDQKVLTQDHTRMCRTQQWGALREENTKPKT